MTTAAPVSNGFIGRKYSNGWVIDSVYPPDLWLVQVHFFCFQSPAPRWATIAITGAILGSNHQGGEKKKNHANRTKWADHILYGKKMKLIYSSKFNPVSGKLLACCKSNG
jgi:hypothetical protein